MSKSLELLIDIRERLARIEEQIKDIRKDTGTMNKELGELRDRVKIVESSCADIKFSWKIIAFIVGFIPTLVAILSILGIL